MLCITATCLLALEIFISLIAGELVIAPRHTESKIGDTTYFNCSTDLEAVEIFWYHGDKYIYNGHGILEPYNGRFEIDRAASIGSHNLVIRSVQPSDAGEYICIDDDGSGTKRSAELVVLDTDPECQSDIHPDGVIGQNIFNIPSDEVQMTCNVTYHGNIPPHLQWKKAGENGFIKNSSTSTVTSTNGLIYTLRFKGDMSLDNASYVCQTLRSTQTQYKCSSEIIKVLYFVEGNTIELNVFRGEQITCIANNSTFPCISQWYHDNFTCPLSCDETITTHLLGIYLCTVRCHARGKDYYFEALKALVVERITPPLLPRSVTQAVAIVVPISIVILAVLTAILIQRIKRKQLSDKTAAENKRLTDRLRLIDKKRADLNKYAKARITGIDGLSVLGSEVFITHQRLPDVDVYDSRTFKFLRHIKVDGMNNIENIVSCSVSNCLYTFDWEFHGFFNALLKIDPNNGKPEVWHINGRGGRVSVASDAHVILNVNFESKLQEYTADGELIREIILDSGTDIFRVWHAVKLPSGLFVICQGCDSEDPINRVCLLKIEETTRRITEVEIVKEFSRDEGDPILHKTRCTMTIIDEVEILKEFGREDGESISRLGHPNFLSVDNDGSILVSDFKTVLLSSNLDKPRILVSEEHGMGILCRTCFDESTGQWFVSNNSRIMVCRVDDENIERTLYEWRLSVGDDFKCEPIIERAPMPQSS